MSNFIIDEETGLKNFEISRATWTRGEWSLLLDETTDKSCCLGFYCLASGQSRDEIAGRGLPEDLDDAGNPEFDWLAISSGSGFTSTDACLEVASLNDSTDITEEEREARLAETFKAHGYLPVFVD